ncbi:hypothetical protein HA44_04090 [Mixta gaviniae]|nr:hypothetical protein HA44_04090 [Mixta gaviniae]
MKLIKGGGEIFFIILLRQRQRNLIRNSELIKRFGKNAIRAFCQRRQADYLLSRLQQRLALL